MDRQHTGRLTDAELLSLFDQLFPHGFGGVDVLSEIAPAGWEQSSLLACFHPSVQRIFEEQLQICRNIEALRRARNCRNKAAETDDAPLAEPTLEEVRREYQPRSVRQDEELTELVGLCLWDVFSDNHDVITVDGRVADIGSFRGASAFLDEHASRDSCDRCRDADYMRFYMGTIWISGRADLSPVYAMIFRRLRSLGADWVYHFPELRLVDLGALGTESDQPPRYSLSEAAAAEVRARKREANLEGLRAEVAASNAQAREKAMDHPPPVTVRAYRQVYGCDPRGWPPG